MSGIEILKSKGKFKIDLGLNRVQKMLEILEHPEKKTKFIHIAGTNGKGSTAAIIEKILLEDGSKKIGKYTSPHLFSYTERFSINGKNIENSELESLINFVNSKDEENKIGLTEFEILTIVCFLYFANHGVEIGILEVGLGGRLDATNVIEKPLISVVTSISYDHKERLGNTIEKISKEKAGIFKKGAKCLFLKENAGYKTLFSEAVSKKAIILPNDLNLDVSDNFATINGVKCPFSLNGDFQKENLKLALLTIFEIFPNISFETVKRALSTVKWRFRMETTELLGQKVLIDGCHNPDGARVLAEYLQKYQKNKKIKFIFGCLQNKDYTKILDTLYNPSYDFCFYEFDYPNVLKYENLGEYSNKLKKITNPIEEIQKGGFELCVVAGSLYMLGQIFKEIF